MKEMTAYLGAFGVMTALYNRDVNNSGGEVIDLSLVEAGFRSSESALTEYSLNGTVRERVGNRNPHFVPAEDFDTKDGKILVINAGTDALWKKLAHDPHMREREAVVEFEDPDKGKVLVPGVFPKMKSAPGKIRFLGAKLDEYNKEIYGGLLGLSVQEISALEKKGVI